MRKYKLIKTYPGSPELGTIIDKRGAFVYFDISNPVTSNTYNETHVENNPEFWQEIIEYSVGTKAYNSLTSTIFTRKEDGWYTEPTKTSYTDKDIRDYKAINILPDEKKGYEILSVLYEHNNKIYTWDGEYFSCQNGTISLENTLKGFIGSKNTGYNIYIHSVKRLSDNAIFTVGDKVKQSNVQHNNTFTITGFEFDVNNEHLLVIGNGGIKLHKIEHCKTPLFTTEDGVEIFKGDKYFYWNSDDTDCIKAYSDYAEDKSNRKLWNKYKCFSTEEATKEYIVINKPCLSINEIGSIIGRFNKTVYVDLDLMNKKLKELVKDKI